MVERVHFAQNHKRTQLNICLLCLVGMKLWQWYTSVLNSLDRRCSQAMPAEHQVDPAIVCKCPENRTNSHANIQPILQNTLSDSVSGIRAYCARLRVVFWHTQRRMTRGHFAYTLLMCA